MSDAQTLDAAPEAGDDSPVEPGADGTGTDPSIARARKQAATERQRRKAAQAEAAEAKAELDALRARLDGDEAQAAEAAVKRELEAANKAKAAAEKVIRNAALKAAAIDAGVSDSSLHGDIYKIAAVDSLDVDIDTGEVFGLSEAVADVVERFPGLTMTTSTKPGVVTDAPGTSSSFDPENPKHIRNLLETDPDEFRKLLDNGTIQIPWEVGGGEIVMQSASRSGGLAAKIERMAGRAPRR